jgi:ArsR family transcriptional regulator
VGSRKDQPLDPETAELIAERFRALTDPTRLLILDHLRRNGETAVGEIAARVGASQQNTSKHLSVLRVQQIIARRKQGTSSLYRIANRNVCEALASADDLKAPKNQQPQPPDTL